ncbi:Protein Mono-Adp-Ribosyltransferase Parp4 [Manis pentadactyla]|nr:Protein Mono-Adp-Ribosyltransferase Parp4 [Manis pentadactyla]
MESVQVGAFMFRINVRPEAHQLPSDELQKPAPAGAAVLGLPGLRSGKPLRAGMKDKPGCRYLDGLRAEVSETS